MKKLNLILTTVALSMNISLTFICWMSGNYTAVSGWGMAVLWCANTLLYQLKDKE
jgi:hypothetical protein